MTIYWLKKILVFVGFSFCSNYSDYEGTNSIISLCYSVKTFRWPWTFLKRLEIPPEARHCASLSLVVQTKNQISDSKITLLSSIFMLFLSLLPFSLPLSLFLFTYKYSFQGIVQEQEDLPATCLRTEHSTHSVHQLPSFLPWVLNAPSSSRDSTGFLNDLFPIINLNIFFKSPSKVFLSSNS